MASLREDVFKVACVHESCHGNGAAWDLWLDDPDLEAELVNARAGGCPGETYVVPGSPEQSFLFRKLVDEEPACGERMPLALGALPSSVLDCISGWIRSLGADAGQDSGSSG
ncbi:MAG TPA: hypothetical protein VK524_19600 [Polyangiaceae bacterium]|nr:hypothetical protein [Polyangiaceae bacterium]